ncbi:MAG: YdcF family protein [Haliea sp.]|nr:MAG: YdcF family protein [Haliea sp.]
MRRAAVFWLLLAIGAALLLQSAYLVTVKVTHFGVMLPAALGAVLVGLALSGKRWTAFLAGAQWRRVAWRVVLGLFLAWLLSLTVFFGWLHRAPAGPGNGPMPLAIVVLGSSTPGGQPSPTLARRLDLALLLAARYPAARVVVSGGVDFTETVAEGEVMASYLRARGLAAERVLVEDRSTSTQENLVFSQQVLKQNGLAADVPMLLVTSDFHTLRAARIARKAGWTNVSTAGAETPLYMRYNAWLREYFAFLSGWLRREF